MAMFAGWVLMVTALVVMYRCVRGKSPRRKTAELAEALVAVKKDFAYKLQRFDYLLEKVADEDDDISLLKKRISNLQEIVGELEEKRDELETGIASLTDIHAELRKSCASLVEKSTRLRDEISHGEQTLRETGQHIDTLKRIKEGLEIALNNLLAEEVHFLSEPVLSMGITPSVRNHLETHGIMYIGDLIPLGESYLMEIWGIGPATLEKIKTKLNENGVWFGMDVIRVGNHWYRRKQEPTTE